jgi:murein L,D-transpeptidase YcbB/YkuD
MERARTIARWWTRALALAVLLALAGCGREAKKAPTPEAPPPLVVEDEIEAIVAARGSDLGLADTVGIARTWTWVDLLYRERHDKPFWSGSRRLKREAKDLIAAVWRAQEAGFDAADFEAAHLERLAAQSEKSNAPSDRMRPRILARFDVTATYALLRLAEQLRAGRVPRRWLDPDWVVDSLTEKRVEGLSRAMGHDPSSALAALEPGHPGYLRLRQALARYRSIAASGGWGVIPPGPPLKRGDAGPRVKRLARRLAWTDDWRSTGPDTVYDASLERAVGSIQARLGIPVSGVVGEATREALNVPVEQRIRQIELNLERWRWLPDSLGARRVEVNIPAYRIELFRDHRVVRAMRVVVGKRKSPTPIFSDRIAYLELNPTWTMPPSVVQKEIAPLVRRNKNYLQTNHMHIYSLLAATRDTLDPRKVPWELAKTDSFPYLVIQDAGPENPLGRIKLMCPNEYDVYLHDTPTRSRFSVAVRDYSHGCVRVEHAVELADSLLEATAQDSLPLDSLIAQGWWKRVRLPKQVPVHFLYWTAWADSAGRMNYREDIYGLDQRLDAALKSRVSHDLDVNPGVSMSQLWLAAEARAREAKERAKAPRGARK